MLVLPRLGGELRVAFQPTGARAAPTAAAAPGGVVAAAAAPGAWRLVGVVATGAGGSPRWRVAYEDIDDVPTAPDAATRVAMPRTARFAEGSTSFEEGVEIKFKERTLGERPEPGVFTVEAPPGTAIMDVGCQGP